MHRTLHLAALLIGSVLVTAGVVAVAPADAAHASAPSTGRYTAVETARVFSDAVTTTPTVVPITGRAGVPADAIAVVVNVEVKSPSAPGYVRVTPAGTDPSVATQEFSAGQSISNLTTVKLSDGGVQVKVSAGTAQVFFDVSGYYADGSGSTYTPVANARVLRADRRPRCGSRSPASAASPRTPPPSRSTSGRSRRATTPGTSV